MRIEIIGNIASGKTTLARLLGTKITGVFEDFQSNPFWEHFYADPVGNAFETELTFTLQHFHAIKTARQGRQPFVCDFSLLLDEAYSAVTLSGRKLGLYNEVLAELLAELGYPDKLIHLSCPPETLLDRIRQRARPAENAITVGYLQSLAESIDNRLAAARQNTDIIVVDSGRLDFAHDDSQQRDVLDTLQASIPASFWSATAHPPASAPADA